MDATASTYPPPPPYYKLYAAYDPHTRTGGPPPPPAITGEYVSFGAPYNTEDRLPSLEEQGVRQLFPSTKNINTRAELKALGRELGLLVLELADVLVERPSQAGRCVEDISLLFTNLHFLLNSLRPHQARATLTHMLKTQLEMRKQSLQGIKEQRAAVWEVLRLAVGEVEAATQGEAGGGGSSKGRAEGVEVEGGGGGKQ
ncbi:unnamed protein product [Closterium sp. NIES-64]|nr:unnamed protein product [Closterium sp. NIES-65]CAI5999991.1 unnamed protein product [Closterium sp. NIES-64]